VNWVELSRQTADCREHPLAEIAYKKLQVDDSRWTARWNDLVLLINPNGPMMQAGSDGDNGQTGRKLVADFYGPRVPIGGGALSGKHMGHIDRVAAYATRFVAVAAVTSGAEECLVRLAYAPNCSEPLDVSYQMVGRGIRQPAPYFHHTALTERFPGRLITKKLGEGTHFFDPSLPWNIGPS
jgi:S-adenosylmethionine synthetase